MFKDVATPKMPDPAPRKAYDKSSWPLVSVTLIIDPLLATARVDKNYHPDPMTWCSTIGAILPWISNVNAKSHIEFPVPILNFFLLKEKMI